MKKIVNITLGGIVFATEIDAYDALATYLESVKQNLSSADDYTEIIADIESALAEKFIARNRNEKFAITNADVLTVTAEMGAPSDFKGDDVSGESDRVTSPVAQTETKKRLYRDTDDSVIAGVASGIAHYFAIDPVVVRIIFFVSVFFNGLGILAYIVLWLVVPKAETTAQKYAARGEKVTLKEITQRVKKNIEKVDVADLDAAKGAWAGARPTFVKIFELFGVVARGVLTIVKYVVGFMLLLGGALSLAGMVSVYSVVLLSDKILLPLEAQTALDIMLGSALGLVAITASFVMMSIPMLVLILAGGSLIVSRSLFTVSKSIALAVVWIVAMMLAGTTSVLQLEQVMQQHNLGEFSGEEYQIQVNVADDGVHIDAGISTAEEEDVASASPSTPVQDLPASEILEGGVD